MRTYRGIVHKDMEALDLLNDLVLVHPRPTGAEKEEAEQQEFQQYVDALLPQGQAPQARGFHLNCYRSRTVLLIVL